MTQGQLIGIIAMSVIFVLLLILAYCSNNYSLNGIKSKKIGDGQHGTARFAKKEEVKKTYTQVPFDVENWRKGRYLPTVQGTVVGCKSHGKQTIALVDEGDVHTLMIGAAGVGKTAFFLYPNLEFACASGMSFLQTDTKGDVFRNYGSIAKKYYDYNVSVLDLRNPTRSDENNILHLVNKYMDIYLSDKHNLSAKAKAEKYAKITMIQDLLEPVWEKQSVKKTAPKSGFKALMERLPDEHKAKWLAGSALHSADQAMLSVMSTALSRLNSFIDSEMEQILCFGTALDAEKFCKEKSAIFIVLPEEDVSKYFMVSLIIQQLYREILVIADENGGRLPNRVMFYCDEFGTFPKIEGAEAMFSASRSRRISIVAIIQSFAQLNKNYGKEGQEIITDNTQLTIFGGFAPNSQSAEVLSKALGEQTILSGSVSHGKEKSQSLQMIGRPLLTVDELKSMPKGQFIVMKTGTHPMISPLKLYFKWGISFEEPYILEDKGARTVTYMSKEALMREVEIQYPQMKKTVSEEDEELEEETPKRRKIPRTGGV